MTFLLPPADGSNARDLIQSTILRDNVARLGPGRFVIDGKLPSSRWDCLQLQGGQSIIGSGPSTTLVFRGEGITVHPVTGVQSGDWRGINITGDDNMLADFAVDTSAMTKTSEQTHAMSVIGRARHLTIRNIVFRHPIRRDATGAVLPGGDCLKIGGYLTNNTPVSAIIDGCHFVECDRSGISSVGGFEALLIRGCVFYDTSDQDIDIEGASGQASNIFCHGNIHLTNPARTNGLAMQIGLQRGLNVHVADCIFDGRGIFYGGLERLLMSNCTVVHKQSGAPTIHVVKANDDVRFVGCTIVRTPAALPNTVLKVQHHGTGMAGIVDIDNCTIRNESQSPSCINIQSAREVGLSRTRFEWRPTGVPAGTTHTLVAVAGLAQRTEALGMHTCRFAGPAQRALSINDKDAGIGAVTLTGNTSPIPIYVQRVTQTPWPIVSSGNNWPTPLGNGTFEEGL